MDITEYSRALRRSWVVIVALFLIGVGAGGAYAAVQPSLYSATATLFVSVQTSANVSEIAQGTSLAQQRVKTYADLATKQIVLQPVIISEGLDITPAELAKTVTASIPPETTLIEISAVAASAPGAATIANAVAESFAAVVADIDRGGTAANSPVLITIAQEATVPEQRVSPNVPLSIAVGAVLGLVAGILFAALRQLLDTRLRSERDIERLTAIPIVGGIAYDAKSRKRRLIVQSDPRSIRAESFRTLRTNIQFLKTNETARSFLVSSPNLGEGKSTTAVNLAIALVDSGVSVLLIDADLRRPRLAEYLSIEGGAGLTDVLIGRAALQETVQKWGEKGLWVLPAGPIPPNPSELLGSPQMQQILDDAAAWFDLVLIDSPPLLPVTDAAVLSKRTSGVLLVVAAGRTSNRQLTGALATLAQVGTEATGIIVNMMPARGSASHAYGHYGYGAQYGDSHPTG